LCPHRGRLLRLKNKVATTPAASDEKAPIREPVQAERLGKLGKLSPLQLEKLRAIAGALNFTHSQCVIEK